MLAINWKVVNEETDKPFLRVLFKAWQHSTAAGNRSTRNRNTSEANVWERLLKIAGGSECKYCNNPVDPDRPNQDYCSRQCGKKYIDSLLGHKKICDNNWNCVMQLDAVLSQFYASPTRNTDKLIVELRATVKSLVDEEVRPTESKVWNQIRTVYRGVKEKADSDQREDLFELCCPRDADESMREDTGRRLEHLHQLVVKLPTLGEIIDKEMKASQDRIH